MAWNSYWFYLTTNHHHNLVIIHIFIFTPTNIIWNCHFFPGFIQFFSQILFTFPWILLDFYLFFLLNLLFFSPFWSSAHFSFHGHLSRGQGAAKGCCDMFCSIDLSFVKHWLENMHYLLDAQSSKLNRMAWNWSGICLELSSFSVSELAVPRWILINLQEFRLDFAPPRSGSNL